MLIFLNNLEEQLDGVDVKRVGLLIVDQHKHERGLKDVMGSFILHLRAVNGSAWIVETSYQRQPNVYKGSNSVQSIGNMRQIFREAGELEGTANRRIEYIIGETSPVLQKARGVQVEDGNLELERYLQEVIREKRARDLFTALNIDLVQFVARVQSLDLSQKSQALHDAFHMIHHLERGSTELVYGNTLARLQQTLQF